MKSFYEYWSILHTFHLDFGQSRAFSELITGLFIFFFFQLQSNLKSKPDLFFLRLPLQIITLMFFPDARAFSSGTQTPAKKNNVDERG